MFFQALDKDAETQKTEKHVLADPYGFCAKLVVAGVIKFLTVFVEPDFREAAFEVLEAEASEVADGAELPASPLGHPRLACILDDDEVVLFGDGHDPVHIRRQAH